MCIGIQDSYCYRFSNRAFCSRWHGQKRWKVQNEIIDQNVDIQRKIIGSKVLISEKKSGKSGTKKKGRDVEIHLFANTYVCVRGEFGYFRGKLCPESCIILSPLRGKKHNGCPLTSSPGEKETSIFAYFSNHHDKMAERNNLKKEGFL